MHSETRGPNGPTTPQPVPAYPPSLPSYLPSLDKERWTIFDLRNAASGWKPEGNCEIPPQFDDLTQSQRGNWIETITGGKLHLLYPHEYFKTLSVEDLLSEIATGLSLKCRFSGQCAFFWPVAMHSIAVKHHVKFLLSPQGSHYRLGATYNELSLNNMLIAALYHDAAEAYYADLASPVKQMIGPIYKALENLAQQAIFDRLGIQINQEEKDTIKFADIACLMYEASVLMRSKGEGWQKQKGWVRSEQYSPNHELQFQVVDIEPASNITILGNIRPITAEQSVSYFAIASGTCGMHGQ